MLPKKLMQISFSGGRTSGYMTHRLIKELSDEYDFIVTFANTGMEHEKTLEFVNNCDKFFRFNTIWLEAVVNEEKRVGTEHRIVSFETASRKGEPFEDVIKKYGVPNPSFLHCTRELKLQPMNSYLRSLGIKVKEIPTAIGIRNDETRRVNKKAAEVQIIYPLIDMWPTDKLDVLDWWEQQDFDLGLDEWDGNCKGCYKKSFKKIFLQLEQDPTMLDWHIKMEDLYKNNGAGGDKGYSRVFFRGNLSARDVLKLKQEADNGLQSKIDQTISGGCSESCEVYSTE